MKVLETKDVEEFYKSLLSMLKAFNEYCEGRIEKNDCKERLEKNNLEFYEEFSHPGTFIFKIVRN